MKELSQQLLKMAAISNGTSNEPLTREHSTRVLMAAVRILKVLDRADQFINNDAAAWEALRPVGVKFFNALRDELNRVAKL